MRIKTSTITIASLVLLLIAMLIGVVQASLYKIVIPHDEKDLFCLTRNAYYEARGDSEMSQIAVTHVVLNRLHNNNYPNGVCDVIYQKNKREKQDAVVCQFSWYCDKSLMRQAINEKAWNESLNAVEKALAFYYQKGVDVTQGATFYHANYVSPGWKNVERVTSIGSHIYYKESVDDGSTRRFSYQKVVLRTN
jgi:spore germination cell wall hydrolase CwlJ-like protein